MALSNDTLLILGFHIQSISSKARGLSIVNTTAQIASHLQFLENQINGASWTYNETVADIAAFVGSTADGISAAYAQASITNSTTMIIEQTGAMANMFRDLPHEPLHVFWDPLMIALPILVVLVVLTRLCARWISIGRIKIEDWLIIVALILGNIAMVVGLVAGNAYGACQHKWDLRWDDAVMNTKLTYICQVLYHPIVFFIKLSTLIFYYSIAPEGNAAYRAVLHVTLALIVVFTVGNSLALAVQCLPVTSVWDFPTETKCVPKLFVAYEHCVSNIAADVILLLLPIYPVCRLGLTIREKLIVLFLFGLGGLVCIISVFRLMAVVVFATSLDTTYAEVNVGVWTALEVNLGILCTSIPLVRSLVMRIMPTLLGHKRPPQGARRTPPRGGAGSFHNIPDEIQVTIGLAKSTLGPTPQPDNIPAAASKFRPMSSIREARESEEVEILPMPRIMEQNRNQRSRNRGIVGDCSWSDREKGIGVAMT